MGSCAAGSSANVTNSTGQVTWNCQGTDGGASAACSIPAATKTTAGAPLPDGWVLKASDRFGTNSDRTVTNFAQLHDRYYEGQFYNRDGNGRVLLPNIVINQEQQTYNHFENAIIFAPDHLTIQGRGNSDGSISSAEMVSVYTARNFCVEATYRIPATDKSWPAFWMYASSPGNDISELDMEQPVTPYQGVHDVTMHNHPESSSLAIADGRFTYNYMNWNDANFDASATPHSYTICYDDTKATVARYIDGGLVYTAPWKWNASLGGTGYGPNAAAIINLAVGGSWPGNVGDPSKYWGDLDVYAVEYYGP